MQQSIWAEIQTVEKSSTDVIGLLPNGLALSCAATLDRELVRAVSGFQNRSILLAAQRRPLERRVGARFGIVERSL
jgi:hypothetical protein